MYGVFHCLFRYLTADTVGEVNLRVNGWIVGGTFALGVYFEGSAVQPQSAMSTSSIGLLAVFSLPASTTIVWRELAWPMNRSWSDQFNDASIISPLLRIVSRRHQCRPLRDSLFHARLPGTAVPGFPVPPLCGWSATGFHRRLSVIGSG